tara:strand:+ start:238 stop:567 length:330 start_codon:yes stop_codon:yes gene_type:complete
MDNYGTPLGPLGLLVIPLSIGLVFAFDSFWMVVSVGAGIGLLIAHVRAVLFVGRFRAASKENPMLQVQNTIHGVGASTQIRFIFFQSILGALIVGLWSAVVAGGWELLT